VTENSYRIYRTRGKLHLTSSR